MQTVKKKIVECIAHMEVNESNSKHSEKVIEKLLEANFWYTQHLEAQQLLVNKAMNVTHAVPK